MCFVSVIYFLVLFNSSQLKGDVLKITLIFGIAEVIGVLTSPKVVNLIPLKLSITITCIIIMILNLVSKYADLTINQVYVVFLFEAYCIGLIWAAFLFF